MAEELSGMSDEALDSLLGQIDGGDLSKPIEVPEPVPEKKEDEKPAEGEKPAEEAKEPEKEAVKDEVASENGDGEDSEEAAEEDDASLPPAIRSRLEVLEVQNAKLTADLERERLLRDRNAGKLGALMQKISKPQDREAAADQDVDGADAERQDPEKSPVSEELAEIRAERVNRAVESAATEFLGQNKPFFEALVKDAGQEVNDKFQADLVGKIREQQEALGEDLFAMSPKLAAKVARTLVDSAFASLKLSLMAEFQKRAGEKSEKSRREVRDRKAGAAGVRSNKTPAMSTDTKQPKSVQDMTDKELEEALAAQQF